MHAVARLTLHPLITNIQASWVKMGHEGCAGLSERRLQRPGRHAHEREHQPRRWHPSRPGDLAADAWPDDRSADRTPRQRTTLYDDASDERIAAGLAAGETDRDHQHTGEEIRAQGRQRREERTAATWIDRSSSDGLTFFEARSGWQPYSPSTGKATAPPGVTALFTLYRQSHYHA